MRQPIKLIVKKGRLRADGTRLISLQYCHSATKRAIIGTGVAIPPQYWNKKTGRLSPDLPVQYGQVSKIEDSLTEMVRKAEDMITFAKRSGVSCPITFLKTNFPLHRNWKIAQMKEDINELDVYFNIERYIDERKDEVKKVTLSVINMMKEHLKSFEAYRNIPITFDSFNYNFYPEFVRFLTYEIQLRRKKVVTRGLRINSIGKTIKCLKIFLANRMAKGIIPNIDLSSYKVIEEDVDAIYLSWKEIAAMYKLDLTNNPTLEIIRDEFVLGCLTGFRFSDYSEIKPEEVRDGMLYISQAKTSDRVVVPLRPETKAILEKYHMEMLYISNVDFNLHIKEVARLAGVADLVKFTYKRGNKTIEDIRPKYAWVMSHTCRRSFCTNEFLDGTPIILIMAISGHKTEKAFRKYI
jgi:integrase